MQHCFVLSRKWLAISSVRDGRRNGKSPKSLRFRCAKLHCPNGQPWFRCATPLLFWSDQLPTQRPCSGQFVAQMSQQAGGRQLWWMERADGHLKQTRLALCYSSCSAFESLIVVLCRCVVLPVAIPLLNSLGEIDMLHVSFIWRLRINKCPKTFRCKYSDDPFRICWNPARQQVVIQQFPRDIAWDWPFQQKSCWSEWNTSILKIVLVGHLQLIFCDRQYHGLHARASTHRLSEVRCRETISTMMCHGSHTLGEQSDKNAPWEIGPSRGWTCSGIVEGLLSRQQEISPKGPFWSKWHSLGTSPRLPSPRLHFHTATRLTISMPLVAKNLTIVLCWSCGHCCSESDNPLSRSTQLGLFIDLRGNVEKKSAYPQDWHLLPRDMHWKSIFANWRAVF